MQVMEEATHLELINPRRMREGYGGHGYAKPTTYPGEKDHEIPAVYVKIAWFIMWLLCKVPPQTIKF